MPIEFLISNKMRCALLMATMVLTGCASTPMPESSYKGFGYFAGHLQKCFEQQYIDARLYSEAKTAYSQIVNLWDYDRAKLRSMIAEDYRNASVDSATCRDIEANSYSLIAKARESRSNARQEQVDINNAIREMNRNKPVYCNQIGSVTMCN